MSKDPLVDKSGLPVPKVGIILFFPIWLVVILLVSSSALALTEEEYQRFRERMVKRQIEARGIANKDVLSAMKKVPRHLFVPSEQRNRAYEDYPLPIGFGQTISQPYIVALMTELLQLKGKDRILEVGTGSGYQAAVLAEIVEEVFTVEIIAPLASRSERTLRDLGYGKVRISQRDGYHGWSEHAPFDAIIVTAAAEFVPPPLVQQLKVGGLMCIPVGPPFTVQNLLLVKKKGQKEFETQVITQVLFVPLTRGKKDD